MNANNKKSLVWATLLIMMGLAAVYGGTRWLMLLVPLAILVWIGAKPRFRSGPN